MDRSSTPTMFQALVSVCFKVGQWPISYKISIGEHSTNSKFEALFGMTMEVVFVIVLLGLLSVDRVECGLAIKLNSEYPAISCRKHSALLTEYGGIGDGKTSNTKAFKKAIDDLSKFSSDGGAQLIIPPGK
ncbi:hypothetical protein IFM89_028621 [Coptis chinensis]|uniref:Polygalacturonase n=1 Tax=Coptis chinensis TaxID=261450 RepID=A0A835IDU1_9MAGN|nr:hypothetical protein IFM89_028621 [Coptis chinensis]